MDNKKCIIQKERDHNNTCVCLRTHTHGNWLGKLYLLTSILNTISLHASLMIGAILYYYIAEYHFKLFDTEFKFVYALCQCGHIVFAINMILVLVRVLRYYKSVFTVDYTDCGI